MASPGAKGFIKPRSAAVAGMNWAMPCAPAGLTAMGRNLLSTQSSRISISGGNELARAAASMLPDNKVSGVSAAQPTDFNTVTHSATMPINAALLLPGLADIAIAGLRLTNLRKNISIISTVTSTHSTAHRNARASLA